MRKSRILWLGLGIAAGSEIKNSTAALALGVFIAFLPVLLYVIIHMTYLVYKSMWKEIEAEINSGTATEY